MSRAWKHNHWLAKRLLTHLDGLGDQPTALQFLTRVQDWLKADIDRVLEKDREANGLDELLTCDLSELPTEYSFLDPARALASLRAEVQDGRPATPWLVQFYFTEGTTVETDKACPMCDAGLVRMVDEANPETEIFVCTELGHEIWPGSQPYSGKARPAPTALLKRLGIIPRA